MIAICLGPKKPFYYITCGINTYLFIYLSSKKFQIIINIKNKSKK